MYIVRMSLSVVDTPWRTWYLHISLTVIFNDYALLYFNQTTEHVFIHLIHRFNYDLGKKLNNTIKILKVLYTKIDSPILAIFVNDFEIF